MSHTCIEYQMHSSIIWPVWLNDIYQLVNSNNIEYQPLTKRQSSDNFQFINPNLKGFFWWFSSSN